MRESSAQLLAKYEIRKSTMQKTIFIEHVQDICATLDFPCEVETGGLFKSRNIVVGNLQTAKTVFTAHYDTQPVLPFPNFIAPQNFIVLVLYNVLVAFIFFAVAGVATVLSSFLFDSFIVVSIIPSLTLLLLIYQMFFGIANKHTANDNTSGCATLFAIMEDLPLADREKVAFVFFDHEEIGLVGSSVFRKKHGGLMNSKLLVNLDCVSDGEHLMLISKKPAQGTPLEGILTACLQEQAEKRGMQYVYARSQNTFYPSDQAVFQNACAIAAFNKHPVVGYYLSRIHTPKDTVFEERNIECIANAAVMYVGKI